MFYDILLHNIISDVLLWVDTHAQMTQNKWAPTLFGVKAQVVTFKIFQNGISYTFDSWFDSSLYIGSCHACGILLFFFNNAVSSILFMTSSKF